MIQKLLVANRGEIALRVLRAARELGIRTVAVASPADRTSMYARFADELVELPVNEPAGSYLRAELLIDAAKKTGAEAIHPGYGFLSERASFSQICADEGLIFVGPPASAMRKLGSKIEAKQLALACSVPIAPGFFEPGATAERLAQEADRIGYPIMLKASAGGGGRGLRAVRDPSEFLEQFRIASSEALNAFGDGAMMVEKLVERPRHVEVQILADQHGNVEALFERECSLQRRRQKLLEEAPAPSMTRFPGLWANMREAAVSLAREAGYVGAGTCEFMVDPVNGEFYFLEVNARLQVEHPVTEAVLGMDLVREQLRIASGLPMQVADEIRRGQRSAINGHAIEARIIAEDPAKGFLPSVGRILAFAVPTGPGIRVDTGFESGAEVSPFYDSLLAKCIVQGSDRDHAIERLRSALLDFHVLGVATNIPFLLDVLEHPDFVAGDYDTGFVDREYSSWAPATGLPAELAAILGAARTTAHFGDAPAPGPWAAKDDFRIAKDGS